MPGPDLADDPPLSARDARAWLEHARSLAPLISSQAAETERGGTLSSPVVEALCEAGLFWVMVPAACGGGDADLLTGMQVVEALATADGSTGWSFMVNASSTAMVAAYCGDSAVAQIFGRGPGPIAAGMFAARGSAVPVDGGHQVSGRFSFGSGCGHATWIGSGAFVRRQGKVVSRPDGQPEMRTFVVPRERVRVLGGWDVMGLAGTGSYDYELPEQFVPAEFGFSLNAPRVERGGPAFQLGVVGLGTGGHAAVALGIGRRALHEIARLAGDRRRSGLARVADQQLFQHDFVLQEAALRSARAYVWEVFGDAQETARRGDAPSAEQQARLRQACTHTHRIAAEVVRFGYAWSGSDGLRNPSAIGRCLRDIQAATQHAFVDPNSLVGAFEQLWPVWQK